MAGEEVDMPLLFFIDKDFLDDPACSNVDDMVLSYTFFRYAFYKVIRPLTHCFLALAGTLTVTSSQTHLKT